MRRAVGSTLIGIASVIGVPGPSAIAAPAEATATTALRSIQPCRLYDSRLPAAGGSKLSAATVEIDVTGRCGVPNEALAAAFTITVTQTEGGPGYATIFPADAPQPNASNVNWSVDRTTQANGALIKLGSGKIRVHVSGTAHLIVDVAGYFVPVTTARAGRFVGTAPRRLFDTRDSSNDANIPDFEPWQPGSARTIPLPEGVPTDAVALSVNITTTESNAGGYFTAYLPGSSPPDASLLNTDGAQQTRAASAIVPVNRDGFALVSSSGGHVIVDLNGYFTGPSGTDTTAGLFVAHQPTRVLDTRTAGRIPTDDTIDLDTTTLTGPVAATVANLTMVRPSAPGYVTAFPRGDSVPEVSSVNVDRQLATTANLSITPTAANGLSLYAARATDFIVDVTGYFTGTPYDGTGPIDMSRIVGLRIIGHSVNNRPITAYRLGTPGAKPVIALAAIHGNETGAQSVTDYLLNRAEIPDGIDLWVIPSANPDGVAADRRTNSRGVDLNRNFATSDWRWQGQGTLRYSGPQPASEPETVALQRFITQVRPRLAIWWHQVGNHVDDQPAVADYGLLERFAALVGMPIKSTYCNPSPCRGTATRYTNDNIAGASSFVVELPSIVTTDLAKRQGDAFLQVAPDA